MLEYLASRMPTIYPRLADLVLECEEAPQGATRAKDYLRKFLETAPSHEKEEVWRRLADLCHATGDTMGEIHALGEVALLPTTGIEGVSGIADRINFRAGS